MFVNLSYRSNNDESSNHDRSFGLLSSRGLTEPPCLVGGHAGRLAHTITGLLTPSRGRALFFSYFYCLYLLVFSFSSFVGWLLFILFYYDITMKSCEFESQPVDSSVFLLLFLFCAVYHDVTVECRQSTASEVSFTCHVCKTSLRATVD